MINALESKFISIFNRQPQYTFFAPGRANIIGEHTDYNDGFVLPFAINQGIYFFSSPNLENTIRIVAADINQHITVNISDITNESSIGWYKFIQQVLKLYSGTPIKGFDMVFGGNLPVGAGISSSSALTCGIIVAIDKMNGYNRSVDEMIQMAVTAERGYGVLGGIMDQFTIFNGQCDKAMILDCSDNTYEYIDFLKEDYSFYLINTQVQHNLLNSNYNQRNQQCKQGLEWINQNFKPISSLREVMLSDLNELKSVMDKMLYNRISYVVEENNRVLKAKDALNNNDADTLGRLLFQSHEGLSVKYEVSCPELDWLVDYSKSKLSFVGARMMGGGFGGCTINLVKGHLEEQIQHDLSESYQSKFGLKPDIICIKPSSGIMEFLSKI